MFAVGENVKLKSKQWFDNKVSKEGYDSVPFCLNVNKREYFGKVYRIDRITEEETEWYKNGKFVKEFHTCYKMYGVDWWFSEPMIERKFEEGMPIE